MSAYFENQTNK